MLICLGGVARAHDPGLSAATVTRAGEELRVVVTLAPSDAESLWADGAAESAAVNSAAWREQMTALARGWWNVTWAERALAVSDVMVELRPGNDLVFDSRYALDAAAAGEDVTLTLARMNELPGGHRCLVLVKGPADEIRAEALLTRSRAAITFALPGDGDGASAETVASGALGTGGLGAPDEAPEGGSRAGAPRLWDFGWLGVIHILTGYDHLLFLLGLLVVCTRVRPMLLIVTSFTVGHAFTLVCATLGWWTMPSALVEPLIAASIVFVAVENVVRKGDMPERRWVLTLFFGLIHGFGFATVLRDLGIAQDGRAMAMPLIGFNLGVELGQLGVAALVLPVLWQLRKNASFRAQGGPLLSTLVGLAGFYWLVERLVTLRA